MMGPGNTIETPWRFTIDKVFSLVISSKKGLENSEALQRLKNLGENNIEISQKRTATSIVFAQLKNWLIIVLIFASIVSFLLGEKLDSIVVLATIFLTVIFGYFQEQKAENAIEKLKKYITSRTRVLRSGRWSEIDTREVVLGDIVNLRIGDRVPADLRLFEVDLLSIDESILTGESIAVVKQIEVIVSHQAESYEQKNIAFAGSFVESGVGKGVVISTGEDTYLGRTAKFLETKTQLTDFQKDIKNFSTFLFKVIMLLTIFVFASNAFLNKGIFNSFLFAVALAVGIAPELLPMIITVTLSQGALSMAKRKVVVKKLIAVEDFGNMDTLCTDKTGTLTEGVVVLSSYKDFRGEAKDEILADALLCSSGFSSVGKNTSNQIDKALWDKEDIYSIKHGLKTYKILDENEFDFERRMMSVVVEDKGKKWLIVKGAPEELLDRCKYVNENEEVNLINKEKSGLLLKQLTNFEDDGYRVVVVAKKKVNKNETTIEDENDLVFEGWLLFEDPVKEDAGEAIKMFKNLGIDIKIISGDAVKIVENVAKKVGLNIGKYEIFTGKMLANLDEIKIAEIAKKGKIFARITTEQKYHLVSSLNQEGHVVAYLGDGVNDAPALRAADVGIAVDTGAEVAKEAADIVLLSKDLKVLAEGIESGRKTFGNITKYILNTISANYGNMFTVAAASLFLPFIPLLPKQILLNNFISDVPLLALATDNVDKSFIKKPRRWNLKLISRFMFYFGLVSSIFDFATILPLIFIWKVSPEVFRTAWFIESSLSEMLVTFTIRTRLVFFRSAVSKLLVGLSVISILVVIALPFSKYGRSLFDFRSMPYHVWLWVIFIPVIYFIAVEIIKNYFYAKFGD